MADTDTEILPNGTGALSEEDERMKQRPADIDADVREMERRKRVEALMSSKLFREELERVLDQQMHEGADAPLLQRIREMVGGRLQTGSFRGPSCVLPINDIRGIEGVGYEKGEKILRCKLAALYRLVDLFGWTQSGVASQLTARLNTAVEQLLISPRGLMPHEVTASSLLKVDMQGTVIDSGTTNYGVHKSGFSVHAAVHAARPDVRCVLHLRSPPVLAISATKQGLLPLCTEAALIGDVAYHRVPTGILDNEERDKIVRVLGPSCKILFLRSQGALCCGSTLEEAFYHAKHLHTAADVQLKLATVPRDQLAVMDDEERKEVYDASRAEGAAESSKWRAGGEEFEALMRMLDNAGFRTGYIYRNPLVKNDVPRPKNDVEVPPAVSSLGYLLEEEEMYRQGIWKKGQGKTGERTRWLNSPNVYQKVEVLETGTNDPKKITKWVDSHNEEWVTDGSPGHSSTPMKIDAALQFVPKNTNPKEFKALQQQIKDNRRADKISAGPQSHILEGVTWDEANRLNAEDASATHTGDHVVLVGAASKGIIQRGYQHNATVYSAPYARNPFEHVSERDLDEYTRRVTGQNNYDTDLSESEAISAAQMTSPVSETETESRDEHRVLRIETKQAPMRSQPEVVLSDDATDFLNAERSHVDRTRGIAQKSKLTRSPNPSTDNKKRDYPRCPNFESLILKYDTPKNDPKCKVNLKKRYDSEPTHADAVEMYNPGCLSSRGSLNSVPSIEWDVKKTDNNFRSQSLPRKLGRKEQPQRYYRSCSHAGFINTFIKNPEPVHYHVPKCRKCGSFNSSYDWEITKRDLKSLGQSSIWHSYENIHKSCLREGDRKVLAICDVVRVKEMDAPVFEVNKEFIDSEEYNEDCYLENTYLSSSTVVDNASLNRTLVEADAVVVESNPDTDMLIDSTEKAIAIITCTGKYVKNIDVTGLKIDSDANKLVDQPTIGQEVVEEMKSEAGVDENGVYRAECVYIETSDSSDKSDSHKSPESNKINTNAGNDIIQELAMEIEETAINKVEEPDVNVDLNAILKFDKTETSANETPSYVDSSVYRVFRAVLKELKNKLCTTAVNELPENKIDFTVDNIEGEYLNFTNELDFDRAVYDSPVKSLITKDVRDFLVPLNFYADVKESPSKFNTCSGKGLETIVEETKVSDSSNESVKDSSGDRNSIDNKTASEIHNSNDGSNEVGKDIDKANMEDCLNKVNNNEEGQETDLPVPKNTVADLSGLEVCENYKISIESSSNEIPSFDSTAEFEKIEAVADVLGILIKRVSIAIVNKDENDFYTTVDQALKIKHKGVKFFNLPDTEELGFKAGELDLYQEPEAVDSGPISTESGDINDNQEERSVFLHKDGDDDEKSKEEIFSILEIVKNIDQETVGHNLTVLSEDSDLDPKTHPFKVCESIVFHIFCTVYCQIKQKYKRDKGNAKAVVTVVDVEDIMFTALPIFDIAIIDEVPVNSEQENEEFKPTLDSETPDHKVSCNPSEVVLESNQMQDDLSVLSNNKVVVSKNEDTDIKIFEDFENISLDLQDEPNVKELNVDRSLHCEQEEILLSEKSKVTDMNVEILAKKGILLEAVVSEVKDINIMNDALELQMDNPDENYECVRVDENEDTAYGLITDIVTNVVNNTVNADDFCISIPENEENDIIPSDNAKDIKIASDQQDEFILMELKRNKDPHCKQDDSVVELSNIEYINIHENVDEVVLVDKLTNFGLIADIVTNIVDNAVYEDTIKLKADENIYSGTSSHASDITSPLTPGLIFNIGVFEGSVAADDFISNKEEVQPIQLTIKNEIISEICDVAQIIPEVAEKQAEFTTDIALECVNIQIDISQDSLIGIITQPEDLAENKDINYDDYTYTAQVQPNSPDEPTSNIKTDEGTDVFENCDTAHNVPNEIEKRAESNTDIANKEICLLEDLSIDRGDAQTHDLTENLEKVDEDVTHSEQDRAITSEEPEEVEINAAFNTDTQTSKNEAIDNCEELFVDSCNLNIQATQVQELSPEVPVKSYIVPKEFDEKAESHTNVAIESSESEAVDLPWQFIMDCGNTETDRLDEKVDDGETQNAQVLAIKLEEARTDPVDNEQEDLNKGSELVAVEEINRIILKITVSTDENEDINETSSNKDCLEGLYEKATSSETELFALDEINQVISNIPDCVDEYDQDNIVTAKSELSISNTVTDLKSLELPVSNLNPNAAPFFMNYGQVEETKDEDIRNNDMDLNLSEIVKQDVFDILDDVLEVVSSMHERYSYENTYSVSPVESNESIEDLCIDEQNFAFTNKISVTEIGAIEEKEDEEQFKIITIDVSKSLEESRLLNHTQTREETTSSLHDDPIVLDIYDNKSYGIDEENKYVTELNIAIKGYPSEFDEYNDSSNGSNEDNGELFIEKHGTPKFVDLVTRDEDGSIDSITYNSHILQSIVENLLQDVISEFVIDDNVSEIINSEVTKDTKDYLTADKTQIADYAVESFSSDDKEENNYIDIPTNKNETFVLDSNNPKIKKINSSEDNAEYEISDGDMAYESCSKTDLDQTYVLGTEVAKDNSELTEVSYFDTAFCEDTMLTNQSSPYKNNSPIFTSCDESPIKNPNTAYLDDSMLYEKCYEISPFDRTVAVQSMSQCVNAGGVKYWLSFDDSSFTEIDDKVKSNRGRKSRDIPTFYSFDTVENLPVSTSNNYDSNAFKHKTSDSSVYVTASCSKSKNDACTSYNPEPSTSKTDENERRLLFDCSNRNKKQFDCVKRSKKGVRRREYDTWPPYDESLFYRIISNFRMSESFDLSDLDNVDYR